MKPGPFFSPTPPALATTWDSFTCCSNAALLPFPFLPTERRSWFQPGVTLTIFFTRPTAKLFATDQFLFCCPSVRTFVCASVTKMDERLWLWWMEGRAEGGWGMEDGELMPAILRLAVQRHAAEELCSAMQLRNGLESAYVFSMRRTFN